MQTSGDDAANLRLTGLAVALRQSSIFSGLSEAELLQIARYAERQQLKRGEILFREGDPVRGFYVVLQGAIEAYRVNESGREQLIHVIPAGGSFAEPAVAGLPGYPAHTRALEPSEVALIRGPEFLDHLRLNSDLALRMLASLSRHLHELVHTIESYRLRDAETRLLHWLLQHADTAAAAAGAGAGGPEEPAVIRLAHSKARWAAELGTRQETLSRLLARLRKAGLLEVKGRTLTLRDRAGLRRMFERSLGRGAE